MSSKTNIGAQLRACSCIADAKKVLETVRAGPAAHKLVETAFSLQGQDVIKRDFIETAIKELEDGNVTKPFTAKPGEGEDNVTKKVSESEGVPSGTGTAGSAQSSQVTQPYKKEGDNDEVTDMQSATGDNQMKEGMPGMYPGIPGGPGLAPGIAQEMGAQMPPLPQMNTPQMLKQMQYTVHEALRGPLQEIHTLREAIKAIDSRLRETETNRGAMTLDIGTVKANGIVRTHPVQETIPQMGNEQLPRTQFPRAKLEETRMEILEMDKMYNAAQ